MTKHKSLSERREEQEDRAIERPASPSLNTLWERRIARRGLLKGAAGFGLMAGAGIGLTGLAGCDKKPDAPDFTFNFPEIAHGVDTTHHVAADHNADVLIRWGDALKPGLPAFDPHTLDAQGQLGRFGYNNDYIGFVPLPYGSGASDHGLLCVNHEYTNDELMFPGLPAGDDNVAAALSEAQVKTCMAAHGNSIVEIQRDGKGNWSVVTGSPFNRRISTLETAIRFTGPAAGHPRLATSTDPEGRTVTGTVNNCAGGITPWGTYLTCEENINYYFGGEANSASEAENYQRMGIPAEHPYPWHRYVPRFDIGQEPNEPNRFGWVVEIDPLDPTQMPVKRTALGRFKHEGCENAPTNDGRLALYMGDDQRFEYAYKFVTRDKFDTKNREANRTLLDNGTLYVARFEEDGSGRWLALIHGQNGLDATNGFLSQADVLIEARRAADILGATPLDRTEDVQPNPLTKKVYFSLTNNSRRATANLNGPDPRPANIWGQIMELTPGLDDHGSDHFTWDLLVLCGNPKNPATGASWNKNITENGWFACPDNLAVDAKGRLWVATDQGDDWAGTTGTADGIWGLETQGEGRGTGHMLFRVPVGAEMCGPCFTPDGTTFFVAVQHPASDGTGEFKGFERKSTFEDPATRWPDFKPDMPPRPSVLAIRRKDGGAVGG